MVSEMQDRKSILICVFKKETAKMTHVYSLYFPERFWFTETCVGRPENCWGATNLVLHLILTANSMRLLLNTFLFNYGDL